MKKILTLLGSMTLVATTAITVVACETEPNITFLDYTSYNYYSAEVLLNELTSINKLQSSFEEAFNKIEREINQNLKNVLPTNPAELEKISEKMAESVKIVYYYSVKSLTFELILWKKGWEKIEKIENEIVFTPLNEKSKTEFITRWKETLPWFIENIETIAKLNKPVKATVVNELDAIIKEFRKIIA